LTQYAQTGEIYQIATKLPSGHQMFRNIFQMATKYVYQPFPFQGPPKFTLIGIFGWKINHLATLHYVDFLAAKM
jgi:hypothetical protein